MSGPVCPSGGVRAQRTTAADRPGRALRSDRGTGTGFLLSAVALLAFVSGCAEAKEVHTMPSTPDWKLTSDAFSEGETIPTEHTCDGADDVSPPLAWTEPPESTAELVLICDDPDAPVGLFTHWLLYGLASETRSLPQGVPKDAELSQADYRGARQGKNDFRKNNTGYSGPCPPRGSTHRYFFTLYALDATLNLEPELDRKALDRAIGGHVLGKTQLMGRFGH